MDVTYVVGGLVTLKEDYLLCKCSVNSVVIDNAIKLLIDQENEIDNLKTLLLGYEIGAIKGRTDEQK